MESHLRLLRVTEFRNAFVFRGLVVWTGLRLAFLVTPMGPPTPIVTVLLIGIVGLAVWLDARRRGESRFLANLGISSLAVPLLAAALPALLEVFIP